jgi:hypothetical protein
VSVVYGEEGTVHGELKKVIQRLDVLIDRFDSLECRLIETGVVPVTVR